MAIRAPFTQHRRAVPDCSYLHTVQLQSSACSRTHNLSVCTPPLTFIHAVAQRGQRQPAGGERLAKVRTRSRANPNSCIPTRALALALTVTLPNLPEVTSAQ